MTEFIPAKFCPGCGYPIVLMMMHNILKEMKLNTQSVLGLDIGCSLLAWNFLPINTFQTHHGRVTPTMLGFKRARPNSICIGMTGDGGAYAIGMQSLAHAVKRDEPITVIVVNNTVYGMTGGQTAPTTLHGQKTDTNLEGNIDDPISGPEFFRPLAHKDAFFARTAVNEPRQLQECFRKAFETQQQGHFSMVEILSFCPTHWKTKGADTIAHLNELKETFKLGII